LNKLVEAEKPSQAKERQCEHCEGKGCSHCGGYGYVWEIA
jgi:hypothetical protein